jgi:hypothetical protein
MSKNAPKGNGLYSLAWWLGYDDFMKVAKRYLPDSLWESTKGHLPDLWIDAHSDRKQYEQRS